MRRKLALIIGHEPPRVEVLARALRRGHFEVLVARRQSEARVLAGTNSPDVVAILAGSPGTAELRFLRSLYEENFGESAPELLLVAREEDAELEEAARCVGVTFVAEPRIAMALPRALVRPSEPGGADAKLLDDVDQAPLAIADFAVFDRLTGLVTPDYLLHRIHEEERKSRRYGLALSLLEIRLEEYPALVAKAGRGAGEELVVRCGGILLQETRDVDVAGWIPDSTFRLLLPCTGREGALVLASRLARTLDHELVSAGARSGLALSLASLSGEDREGTPPDLLRSLEPIALP
jgi:PleD family two-component response regulator